MKFTRASLYKILLILFCVGIILIVIGYTFAPNHNPFASLHRKPTQGTLIASYKTTHGDHVDIYQNSERNGGWIDSWTEGGLYKNKVIPFCNGYTFTVKDIDFHWVHVDDKPSSSKLTDSRIWAWGIHIRHGSFVSFQTWNTAPQIDSSAIDSTDDFTNTDLNKKLYCPLKTDTTPHATEHHGNKVS